MFVPPTWLEGFLIQFVIFVVVPFFVAGILGIILGKVSRDWEIGFGCFIVAFLIGFFVMIPV